MAFKNTTFKNVSFVSLGNISNAFLGFILLTAVAKNLSLADFGKYAVLTSLLTLVSRIMDFGTNSLYVASQDENSKRARLFISTRLIMFLLTLPIALMTLKAFGLLSGEIFLLFMLGVIAYGFNYTFYAFYQKDQKYLEVVMLNFIPSVVKAAFGTALFLGIFEVSLTSAFGIFAVSIFTGLLVTLRSKISKTPDIWKLTFDTKEIIGFIKTALSPGISQLIYESWQTVNNFLAKIFNTYTDVGLFSMANKISNIFTLISFSIFTVLLPKNAKNKSELEKKQQTNKFDFYETAILSIAVLVLSIAAIVVARLFISNLFGHKFDSSVKFLEILIFASGINAIQNFAENYFYVEQKTNYLIKINASRLGLLIVIASLTIPVYGLTSLAIANLVTAIFGIVLSFLFIKKLEKLKEVRTSAGVF